MGEKLTKDWYTISEAARHLGCSRQAVHQLIEGVWQGRGCEPKQKEGTVIVRWLIPASLLAEYKPNPLRQEVGRRNATRPSHKRTALHRGGGKQHRPRGDRTTGGI